MDSVNALKQCTETFFQRHWPTAEAFPEWQFDWAWKGPVPNYRLGGLYALIADEKVIYVGLGNSRGGGIYQERGISRRLEYHVLQKVTQSQGVFYQPKKRWQDAGVKQLATLGFPREWSYLAPALEDFLIGELAPLENKIRKLKS